MPITWKNVQNAGGHVAGARLMESASKSFNKGMGNFGTILDEAQTISDDNRTAKIDNTNSAFKDYLAGFESPEAIDAAQASGEIDAEKARLGGFLDKNLARDGARDRLTETRTEANADYAYNQNVLDQKTAPLEETYKGLINEGKFKEADAFLQTNRDPLTEGGDLANLTAYGKQQYSADADRRFQIEKRGRTRKEWDIADAERESLAAADNFSVQALTGLESSNVEAGQALNQLAIDLGVPVGPDGKVDWRQGNPEQRAAFQEQATNSGLLEGKTDTQTIQETLSAYRSSPNYSRDGLRRLEENLNSDLASKNNISENDQRLRTKARADLDTEYGIARNSLANSQSTDPAADARKVIDSVLGKEDSALNSFFNSRQANSEEVEYAVSDALQSGVSLPIYNDAGKLIDTQTYPVTPAMVETALGLTRSDWTDFGEKNVSTLLQEYVQSSGYQDTYDKYSKHQAKVTDLESTWEGSSSRVAGGRDEVIASFQQSMPKPTVEKDPQGAPTQDRVLPEVLQAPPAAAPQQASTGAGGYLDTLGWLGNNIADGVSAAKEANSARQDANIAEATQERAQRATQLAASNKLWDLSKTELVLVMDNELLSEEVRTAVQTELMKRQLRGSR